MRAIQQRLDQDNQHRRWMKMQLSSSFKLLSCIVTNTYKARLNLECIIRRDKKGISTTEYTCCFYISNKFIINKQIKTLNAYSCGHRGRLSYINLN